VLDRALDVVFPPRCAGCCEGPWPFCDPCRDALIPLEPPWCARCGRPTPGPVPSCRSCPPDPIATARAPFSYDGPAKKAIHRLKFSGWRTVAGALAAAMAATSPTEADIVTWVPLARRRRAERGYDQARALAHALAPLLGLPDRALLRRRASTGAQARRPGTERRAAMAGAFAAISRVAPRRVLLVDDVLTTGATAADCARALVEAGARQVHVVTAARAVRGGR
jgi:ComF family protein